MKPLTASVVGGGQGGRLSMLALAKSERFQLVAATDVRHAVCEQLKTEFPGLQCFNAHAEMFRNIPTDVVCVSTWAPSHKQVALDALANPLKGILVEKPLGDTAQAGHDIVDAVRTRNLPMAVPHGLLVAPHAQEILTRVHSGDIGQLTLVEIESSGWDIINAGIHWLNFFVVLIGNDPIDHVMAMCDSTTRTYRDGMQVETSAVTSVQTRSGVRCVMHTGNHLNIMRSQKQTLFRLIGTCGTIEFWGWESSYYIVNAAFPSGKMFHVQPSPISSHQSHLENLAQQIELNQPDYSIPTASLTALELCEAAYLSSRHRCQIDFPLATFNFPAPNDWQPGQPYTPGSGGEDGRNLKSTPRIRIPTIIAS
jgi:predicted dehydrogenase